MHLKRFSLASLYEKTKSFSQIKMYMYIGNYICENDILNNFFCDWFQSFGEGKVLVFTRISFNKFKDIHWIKIDHKGLGSLLINFCPANIEFFLQRA